MKTFIIKIFLQLTLLLIVCTIAIGQNINKPNKIGPLGTEVNTSSGNLYIPRNDVYIPARGFDINLSFFYNSFFYDTTMGFGKGWSCSYGIQYKNDTANSKVIFWGDGREDRYKFSGGNYIAPTGFFNTLTQYQPNKYLLEELDGTKFYFDNAVHKKITKLIEPNGNFINFIYTDSLLNAITNTAGQSITLSYTNGYLTTVVDAITSPTRTYSYSYNSNGNLTQVTDPLGGTMKYTYLVNGPMKTMSDKNNNTVDIIYYNNYTIREIIGCNKRQSFAYDTTTNVSIVTDYLPNGNNQITNYQYEKFGDLIWLKKMSGNCCGFNMQFEFDEVGNKIKETDANGNVTLFTYDSKGNLVSIKDALNQVMNYSYNTAFNTLQSYTDSKGNVYNFTYDVKGNLTQLTEPGNLNYTATYNANGDITSSTDAKGNTYTYNYDSYGNPTTVTGPNGYTATLSIDARGNLLSYKDARNNTTTLQYDILNRLKTITNPINQAIQINYDAEGNVTSIKNENNETSTFSYDASNRMVKATDPIGNKAQIGYDAMDNVIAVQNAIGNGASFSYDNLNRIIGGTDAMGNRFTIDYDGNGNILSIHMPNGLNRNFTYDKLDRVVTVTDDNGNNGSLQYDANGNVKQITNATGATTNATYDNLNRIKTITDALGNTTTLNYDINGSVTSIIDRNGNTSNYTYDSTDRVKTYTDAIGGIVTIGYDAQGNIASLKDQNNNITLYTYDSLNRNKRMTYPDGKFVEYTYDKKSNVLSKKLADGTLINFQYDSINRPIVKTLPNGHTYTYTYDAIGRLKTATNNSGTVTFAYDNLDRLISENFDNKTTRYSYDIPNRTQTTIYPDSTIILKTFDKRNNLIAVTKNGQNIVVIAYNNSNQMISKTFANGVVTNYQYDVANRLTNITTANGAIQNTSFTYDKEGNKKTIVRNNNVANSEEFNYDAAYRMIGYKKGTIGGTPSINNTYTYDLLGNRTAANLNGVATTYTTNNLNQMLNLNNGTQNINFTYDNNGNQTYNGTYFKKYDAEGRLLMDSASTTNKITYQYDAFGRRTRKATLSNSFKYGYSGLSQIELRDGNTDTIQTKTIFANFLTPIQNEKSNKKYYYHPNELGSVESVSSASGNSIENYAYDPYGKTSITDSLGNTIANTATGNRFGYTGQELDAETNDYHFYFRNYNSTTGTFYQRDLIGYGDGMGMYQYVGNDPANGVDVLGLRRVPCPGDDTKNDEFTAAQKAIIAGLSKLANEISMQNTKLKLISGKDFNDRSGKAKIANLVLSSTNLLLKIKDFNNNIHSMTKDEAQAEATDIEMAAVGVLNDVGIVEKIPLIGKTMNLGLGAYGGLDAWVSEKIPGNTSLTKRLALAYAGMDNVSEELGNQMIKHSSLAQKRFNWDKEYLWHTRKMHGNNKRNWTQEARDIDDRHTVAKGQGNLKYTGKLNWDCPQNGPKGGTQKPPPIGAVIGGIKGSGTGIAAFDPNEIIGPIGQPSKAWVSVNDRLPYTITYENAKAAGAPAKYVKVITPIEPKQDPATFQLGNFAFNNLTFNVPTNAPSYYNRLDCRDSLGLYVDVTAGYDVLKNEAFWEFQSIDPVTLLPPTDPFKGFLLLQDSSKPANGHGFVNFSIKPKANAITLDTIVAKAKIVFDSNDTIPTNLHKNTIDAVAPTSHITNAVFLDSSKVKLKWIGTDDVNGCGVLKYNVYVSANGGGYALYQADIKDTTLVFKGAPGNTYCFFTAAFDTVLNMEALKNSCDISVSFTGVTLPLTWLYFNVNKQATDAKLSWATSSELNTKEFEVQRSLDGINFIPIGTVRANGTSSTLHSYDLIDKNIADYKVKTIYYRIKQIDNNGSFTYSRVASIKLDNNKAETIINAFPNPFTETLTVSITAALANNKTEKIELFTADGTLVYTKKMNKQGSNVTLLNDMPRLTNGMYVLRIVIAGKPYSMKVLKQ
jgi:RHS repeat-associated protein